MAIYLSTLPRKTKRLVLRTARLTKAKLLGEAKRFYRTYVSKTALTHTVERTATVEGSAGVAIVALYPRGPLLASVTRLISTLVDEKYLVIGVVNKSRLSPEWITALAAMNITLLSRPNVGRDFGAYKVGYLFAEAHGLLATAKHLLFANDSVFYGPRSQAFISDLLKDEHVWTAMFVSNQIDTHAQSFFQRFSSEQFLHSAFKKFWHTYYPSEERNHTIKKGEIRLSTTLTALEYTPHAYVTADRVLSNSAFGDFTENEKHNIRHVAIARRTAQLSLERHQLETLMRAQYHTSNITHVQGTLTSRVLGAPLKLDMLPLYVTQEAMRDALIALGTPPDEALAILTFMVTSQNKRSAQTARSLHSLMSALHHTLAPRTYLEVGVFTGDSLKLATCPAVGIDPAPQVTQRLPATARVITSTGDDFFATSRPLESVFPTKAPRRGDGELFAEFALIDGMHHAEFALRDFMNIERNSAPWSVIVFDDALPENPEQALRTRATSSWTGDVFRVEQVLKRYRPDLVTLRVDTATGALLVFGLNHLDQRLTTSYEQIVAEYVQPDPQVVPDEVLRRDGVISIDALIQSGVLQVIRTAREQKASSEWVAREVRARLSGK